MLVVKTDFENGYAKTMQKVPICEKPDMDSGSRVNIDKLVVTIL